jgi:hypothetical protein
MHLARKVSLLGVALGALLVVAALSLGGAGSTKAAKIAFTVTLLGSEEVPPVVSPGSGIASFVFDDQTRRLDFTVTLQNIALDQVTAAHIHRGAPGVNGPILHNLSTTPFQTVSGSVTLSQADVADMLAGNLYVNAHSRAHPGGFARGQIIVPSTATNTPEDTVRAAVAAWNARDVTRFVSLFTPEALREEFGPTAEEDLPMFIGSIPISFRSISNVQIAGNNASAVVELTFGIAIQREQWSFVLSGGIWKVAGFGDQLPVPIPAGVTKVDVRMVEYAFIYDKALASRGNIAFDAVNAGAEEHELVLARITSNRSLLEIAQSEDEPEDIEFMAGAGPWDPGERGTVVLTQPLAAGRYGLFCFIEAPDGTPHALLGMMSDFNVGTSAGPISPPSTGNAGLLANDGVSSAMLVAGALLLVISLGGALMTRRARS